MLAKSSCAKKWNRINSLYRSIEKTRPDLGTSKTSKKYKTWIKKVNTRSKLLTTARRKCQPEFFN